MFRKKPAFAIFAILTLAIGIGINTTVFTLMNALLLRPLPVGHPEELVRLYQKTADGTLQQRFSYPDYEAMRDRNSSFSGTGAVALLPFQLEAASNDSQILGEAVSANYFSVLNVAPAAGRLLSAEDAKEGATPAAVISYAAWQQRFSGDPGILQQNMRLNGGVYAIVGVMNQKFLGTYPGARIDVWVSLTASPSILGSNWQTDTGKPSVQVIARLKPSTSTEQAYAELNAIAKHLEKPERLAGIEIAPATLLHGKLRKAASLFFIVLSALMGLVLLIACSNLAGLLLTKALERRREMAVRISLGADRARIAMQLLVENLLLAFAGGFVGLLAAYWCADLLVSLWPIPTVPVLFDLSPDWRIFTFAFSVSLLSGVLIGLTPLLQAARQDVMAMLKEEIGTSTHQRMRLKNALIVSQITFSMLLLICAGLFIRSWRNAQTLNPGFNYKNMLAMDISLSDRGYPEAQAIQYFDTLMQRVLAIPDVVSAAYSDLAPMDLATPRTKAQIQGQQPPAGQDSLLISSNRVSPGYFQAMQIPLLMGAEFTEKDDKNAPAVVIINETMAKRYWPGKNAIGKAFKTGDTFETATVIGVAKDVKYRTPGEEPTPHMYLCYRQFDGSGLTLLVRTRQSPKALLKPIQTEMSLVDKDVKAFFARTMDEHLAFSLLPSKLGGSLLGVFGLIALLLASIGIYAAVSFHVAQRTREIGIRMAIGAKPGAILNVFVLEGLRLSVAGSLLGVIAALVVTRFLASLLIGIGVYDPVTFLAVPAILIVVSLIACSVPAYRASKLDPLRALRYE